MGTIVDTSKVIAFLLRESSKKKGNLPSRCQLNLTIRRRLKRRLLADHLRKQNSRKMQENLRHRRRKNRRRPRLRRTRRRATLAKCALQGQMIPYWIIY